MSTKRLSLSLALGGIALSGWVAAAERGSPLIVRASPLLASCVDVAARRQVGAAVRIDSSAGLDAADVLVGADVEVTRALEAGAAILDSDLDVARIPWVLRVPVGNPSRIESLEDALARGLELVLPQDAAAYEARRLAAGRGDRVREAANPGELRSAPVALVPLSWAGAGERVSVDLRPIEVRATVLTGTKQVAAARAFVSFLASEDGQRAFASCGNTR